METEPTWPKTLWYGVRDAAHPDAAEAFESCGTDAHSGANNAQEEKDVNLMMPENVLDLLKVMNLPAFLRLVEVVSATPQNGMPFCQDPALLHESESQIARPRHCL